MADLIAFLKQIKTIYTEYFGKAAAVGPGLSETDIVYVRNLSAAVEERDASYLQRMIVIIGVCIFVAITWAAWAKLDQVVRAQGKVIPTSSVQVLQSLEGGVLTELLVKEGDVVQLNQALVKISDIAFQGSFAENRIKYYELRARAARLRAEAVQAELANDAEVLATMPHLMTAERKLFESNKIEIDQSVSILGERIKQAENELMESEVRAKQMQRSLKILQREIEITEPLVARNVIPEVEFLQLQGKESQALGELKSLQLLIPRTQSALAAAMRQREVSLLEFQNRARKELNEVTAEIARIEEAQITRADRIARTTLRSPVKGVVKRLFNKTLGGVVAPGADVAEVVPSEDELLIEVQIKPADIAHVELGQPCRIKFTAYDFAIYGSLHGTLHFLSADTVTDEQGVSYYIARIRPDQDYFGHQDKPLPIKVGMTTEVDVITGKKTVLNALLKPFNRALDKALKEV